MFKKTTLLLALLIPATFSTVLVAHTDACGSYCTHNAHECDEVIQNDKCDDCKKVFSECTCNQEDGDDSE